jgi:diguanylate cyclase (GGDEF)-like protein
MTWRRGKADWFNGAAGFLVAAAVLLRLWDARLPARTWAVEAWLIGAGLAFGLGAFVVRRALRGRYPTAHLAIVAITTAFTIAVLAVAAPWIDDLAPLAGLVAIACFLNAAAVRTTEWIRPQARRTDAIALAAQRVGLSTELSEVVAAVLTASRDVFPDADFGGVLVFNRDTEKLVPLPMAMVAGVIEESKAQASFAMSPGEGVAGKVFLAGEPRCWATPEEVAAEHGNMRAATREQILAITGGIRSVAVAPLKLPDRGVIGVLTLGSSRRERVWAEGDLVVVQGLAEQAALGVERARMYQEQRAQALTDPLTGLANYRRLKNVLAQEVARARRAETSLAVVFCDLDGFKRVNDLHGHHAGDGVLRLLARTMAEVLRTEDLAARYGGDEFICIIPGADREQAETVSRRIAQRFSELLAGDAELRRIATCPTAGVALYPDQGSSADEVMAAADAALMVAKQTIWQRGPASG